MYFSKNEKSVVEKFYKNISILNENDILSLVWENGEIKATFDTCFDDFDANDENDEYTSFVFKKVEVGNRISFDTEQSDYIIVNYHNFPREILLNGKKIN